MEGGRGHFESQANEHESDADIRQAMGLFKNWPPGHYRLADLYAQRGEWEKAAAQYAVYFAQGKGNNPFVWFEYACLLVQTGDAAGYHKLCERMRERFGNSQDVEDVAMLAHTWVLLAAS